MQRSRIGERSACTVPLRDLWFRWPVQGFHISTRMQGHRKNLTILSSTLCTFQRRCTRLRSNMRYADFSIFVLDCWDSRMVRSLPLLHNVASSQPSAILHSAVHCSPALPDLLVHGTAQEPLMSVVIMYTYQYSQIQEGFGGVLFSSAKDFDIMMLSTNKLHSLNLPHKGRMKSDANQPQLDPAPLSSFIICVRISTVMMPFK